MLNHRRATIYPIPTIDVFKPIDVSDRGAVNVSANDAIETAIAHGTNNGVFKIKDEGHCALDPLLGVTSQRPVARSAQQATYARQKTIQMDQTVVADISQHRQPTMMAGDLIKLVAVNQQKIPSIGQSVDVFFLDQDVAERNTVVFAE